MGELKKHLIFTIIAPNYGAQAMILGESVLKNMPESIFRIVVLQDCQDVSYIQRGIDEYLRINNSQGDHKAVSFQDFDWSNFEITNAVNQYDLLEFATSVKPTILSNYIRSGYERVTYLDPDIQVFTDFTNTLDSSKCISVTPHLLTDFPLDSKLPNQQSILYAGIYNLGFISVKAESLPFLTWWEEKLTLYCSMEVQKGYHVDQRWVDWATCFADIDVVRDPGLNVAYWNLHERTVNGSSEYKINFINSKTYELRFFHFSGFIGPSVKKISKHCTRNFSETPALNKVLGDYSKRRKFWGEFLGDTVWSLGGRLGGSSLPSSWRKEILSKNRDRYFLNHNRNLEVQISTPGYCGCANCNSEFAQNSTTLLLSQIESNFVSGIDLSRHQRLFKELVSIGYSRKSSELNTLSAVPKVKLLLIGYFGAPTGVGQIARNTLRLLENSGVSVNIHTIQTGFDDASLISKYQGKSQMTGKESSVIAFVNADMWIEHLVKTRLINLETQNVAGVWAWEIEKVPEYFRNAALHATKVYAISQFSANALSIYFGEKIDVFPTYGNIPLEFNKSVTQKSNQRSYVLARFDAKSVIERKNPQAVLDVWDLVKDQLIGYELLIKTIDFRKYAPIDLMNRIKGSERVQLIDEVYSENQNKSLLESASVFISLHRAEGLGLNILEGLTADIPTISTNYSGLSEEIEKFVFPVDYTLIPIGENAAPYPPEGFWANPSTTSAAEQLIKAINLVENGDWENEKKSRLAQLEYYLQMAQTQAMAHTVQLLAQGKSNEKSEIELLRRVRIRNFRSLLPIFHRMPKPIRILLRRIFLRYFQV